MAAAMPESSATRRARERGYFDRGPEWYCEFRYAPVPGLEQEDGVHRRDPTSVILVGSRYHCWYTKSVGAHVGFGTGAADAKVFPWDQSDVWHATSADGITWREEGPAVERGDAGTYDDRSVFTPEILYHGDRFYLVYQCVQSPYVNRVKNTIGMSVAESPGGPWRRLAAPILSPSDDGEWKGEADNRFLVTSKGSFDSHKVHDPVLFFFRDQFYLYYKGERMGEQMFMGGRETRWGLAIADRPEGPYKKSPYNPVTNSGHETLLWHHNGGLAALLSTDGMERNTMQFAEDGINFEIMGGVKGAPQAAGPFRGTTGDRPLDGLTWGLCHEVHQGWGHILRFEKDEHLKEAYVSQTSYE